ncbi:MAG: plastocyanin/azurin family copper-binding protein [Acidimicrobiales bacterium]
MRALRTLGAAALVAGLVACGSGEPVANSTPTTTKPEKADTLDLTDVSFEDLTGADTADVEARDNTYVAQFIEVDAGTTVTFTNKGRNQHNVVPAEDGAFASLDTEDFEPGESGSITFSEPGDYVYYCTLHGTKRKGMVGAVRVLGE